MRDFVLKNTIFMTVAGSRMYGTNTPASDIDKRGVCIPPKEVMLGCANRFEQQDVEGEDTVIYGLQKFMKLAADCNPNIIELLYAPEDCIETTSEIWEILCDRRDEFLSSHAYVKFNGYAMGQLKRIKSHRAWLLNPPTHKPTRKEFGLEDSGHGVRATAKGIDLEKVSPELLKVVHQEQAFKSAMKTWSQYQNWKANRNEARAELEAAHGYDTKHAMHLVRLLRLGKEILTKGTLTVRRPDAEELLAIRRGAWTYDELMEYIQPLKEEMEELYQSKEYVVKDKVDVNALSDLCAELHIKHWEG